MFFLCLFLGLAFCFSVLIYPTPKYSHLHCYRYRRAYQFIFLYHCISPMRLLYYNPAAHYENTAMQYTEIFFRSQNRNLHFGKNDFFFKFLIKTPIVGTHWNRLNEEVLTSIHNLCFESKIKKKIEIPVPPTLKKLAGHIAFGLSVCVCVSSSVSHFFFF